LMFQRSTKAENAWAHAKSQCLAMGWVGNEMSWQRVRRQLKMSGNHNIGSWILRSREGMWPSSAHLEGFPVPIACQ
jgi:hypothetical protein